VKNGEWGTGNGEREDSPDELTDKSSPNAVSAAAEYLPSFFAPTVVPSASLKTRFSSVVVGNNRNNFEDILQEDDSQPQAGFRRANRSGVLLMLFFTLFMLLAAIISNFANTNLVAILWRFPNFTLGCRTFATPARFWENSDG